MRWEVKDVRSGRANERKLAEVMALRCGVDGPAFSASLSDCAPCDSSGHFDGSGCVRRALWDIVGVEVKTDGSVRRVPWTL